LGPTSFSVLERQGLVKTLAEPTLTALSGQTASFLSGQQTPSVTGVDQNGNAIIEYKDLGIRLSFTPTVIDENQINLEVSTEVSSISTSNVSVLGETLPNYDVKNTETTIDLPSGGSLMIAGLLKDNMTNTLDGFPYLKDIPVLGALFRSHAFLREETELVVTVTVYLAKPTGADAPLALPSDGFEPASDIDLYILGRLHREYAKKELPIWAAPLKGPFGYIME
jgi:pilus assembly protein CpaC